MISGGDMEPGLSHQGEQSYGLKGHCLTACVRSGDDEKCEVFSQRDRDRDDRLRVQERMAPLADADAPLLVEHGPAGVHGESKCASRKNEVQVSHGAVICPDLFDILCRLTAQAGKDDLDLLLLLGIEFL